MRLGFVWLATQNHRLFRLNQNLSNQLEKMEES